MTITQLQEELEANFVKISGADDKVRSFEILFNLYNQSEKIQDTKFGAGNIDIESLSNQLGQTQDSLISLSAELTATSIEQVLFKMALWRRYAAQINPFDADMTGDEKLGYSIFKDLALMCQRDDVFTDADKLYVSSLGG